MTVPEEIRKIERPTNTIIVPYGKDKDRYAVKIRVGCRSVNGRKIPIDGPIIGHIIDGKFVPKTEIPGIKFSETDYKRWADVQLFMNNSKDILEGLREVYNNEDALKIYSIALLRALDADINDYELSCEYKGSWLSETYPGVALSKNTVSDFLYDLGRTCSRISLFMQKRTASVSANCHLAVDGTLKSNESTVNTFSDYSRKALKKGTKDISVVYAYNIETGEPVCSKAYPGNQIDISLLDDFIRTNKVDKGIIIADKGFSQNAAKAAFAERPELHFLIPLRRDSSYIGKYRMYDYNNTLADHPGITCRKEKTVDGKYLYSYHDAQLASNEETTWTKNKEDCDPSELNEKRKMFGSIVFISDVDMDLSVAYAAYEERWEIELMFRFYKDILKFDQTKVHEDCSVIGTEFINFLSVLIVCRIRKVFSGIEMIDGVPYDTVMKKLKRVTKIKESDGTWTFRKITEGEKELITELGLMPRMVDVKNPVGRPRKGSIEAKIKRPRGRPKKNPS